MGRGDPEWEETFNVFSDVYKEWSGTRPRDQRYLSMTVDDLEEEISWMLQDMDDHPDSRSDFYDYDEPVDPNPDPLQKMELDPHDVEDVMAHDREEDWQHTPKRAGARRPFEGLDRD